MSRFTPPRSGSRNQKTRTEKLSQFINFEYFRRFLRELTEEITTLEEAVDAVEAIGGEVKKSDLKVNLDALPREEGSLYWAIDLAKLFYDDGSTLVEVGPGAGGGGGDFFFSDTYANISSLRSSGSLVPGAMYHIVDRDIYIIANSESSISLHGTLLAYNPDHQSSGDYSDSAIAFTSNKGIWRNVFTVAYSGASGTFEVGDRVSSDGGAAACQILSVTPTEIVVMALTFGASSFDWGSGNLITSSVTETTATVNGAPIPDTTYLVGDVVIWDNNHYQNTTGSSTFDNPKLDAVNWSLMPKDGTNQGYIREADYIEYDFEADFITRRKDKRGNDIMMSALVWSFFSGFLPNTPFEGFKWGYDFCIGNISENSYFGTANLPSGQIFENTLNATSVLINIHFDPDSSIEFSGNLFERGTLANVGFAQSSQFNDNIIRSKGGDGYTDITLGSTTFRRNTFQEGSKGSNMYFINSSVFDNVIEPGANMFGINSFFGQIGRVRLSSYKEMSNISIINSYITECDFVNDIVGSEQIVLEGNENALDGFGRRIKWRYSINLTSPDQVGNNGYLPIIPGQGLVRDENFVRTINLFKFPKHFKVDIKDFSIKRISKFEGVSVSSAYGSVHVVTSNTGNIDLIADSSQILNGIEPNQSLTEGPFELSVDNGGGRSSGSGSFAGGFVEIIQQENMPFYGEAEEDVFCQLKLTTGISDPESETLVSNPQRSTVACTSLSAANSGAYFIYQDGGATYWVWYNVDGNGGAPLPGGGEQLIEVPINSTDGNTLVARKTKIFMEDFGVQSFIYLGVPSSNILTLISNDYVFYAPISDGGVPTGFTFDTEIVGGTSPDFFSSFTGGIIEVSYLLELV